MSTILENVGNHAAGWSVTADRIKARIDIARWTVFAFSIAGALVAAVASQIPQTPPDKPNGHLYVAVFGALLLATATFFSRRLLGEDDIRAWVRARAASEALKREAFKFAAAAAPYSDSKTAEATLDGEREKIESDVDDLVGRLVEPNRLSSAPRQPLSREDYRKRRVYAQIEFYRPRAARYRTRATWLRRVEFVLALAATLITAVSGVTGKTSMIGGIQFDFASLTAVLTTVSGAILAHIEASHFDQLVATYLATARRLEDEDTKYPATGAQDWSDFVNRCEAIISAENMSWLAKWSKPV